jgi:sulfur carrier protein ThiS
MTVKLVYRGKEYDVQEGMTVRDAIKKVGLQPETILAVHGGKLLTDDTILKSDMKTIKLVAVISGGDSLPCSRSLRTGEGWGEGVQ